MKKSISFKTFVIFVSFVFISSFFPIHSSTHLLIYQFVPQNVYAETYVGGRISENTTWTKAASPYVITSDIQVCGDVNNPVTLTIEPGVEVHGAIELRCYLDIRELR